MAAAVLAVLALIAGCYFAAPVVLPTVVALFMAMLVAPVAAGLTRRGLGRAWAALLAVCLALLVVFLGGFAFYRAAAGVAQQAPQYQSKLKHAASTVERRVNHLRRKTEKLVPQDEGQGGGAPARGSQAGAAPAPASGAGSGGGRAGGGMAAVLLRGLGTLFEAAGLALFVPFLALFLLMEEEPLSAAFDRAAGPGYDAARLRRDAPRMARRYVFGNVLLALALALIQGGLFLALGLSNAVGLGLVTGFLNVIPLLGVPLAIALPVLQGLGTFTGAAPYVAIVGGLLALHLFSANVVIPRWIGVHVKVNSTAATLAMLFFSWLWGLTGFLMAVPLAAVIKIALDCSPKTAPLGALLASHEAAAAPGTPRPASRGPLARLRQRLGLRSGWSRRRGSTRSAV